MSDTMYVCKKCGGDHLSMVSDENAYKGFDTHCWDCNGPTNKIEVPFPAEEEEIPTLASIVEQIDQDKVAAGDRIEMSKLNGCLKGLIGIMLENFDAVDKLVGEVDTFKDSLRLDLARKSAQRVRDAMELVK